MSRNYEKLGKQGADCHRSIGSPHPSMNERSSRFDDDEDAVVVAVDEPVEGHVASLHHPWLKRTNILVQVSKPPGPGLSDKEKFGPVSCRAGRAELYPQSALLNLPRPARIPVWSGPFPSMATTNKYLALMNKSPGRGRSD